MDDLREYTVRLHGADTTMMLTDADAERLGGVLLNPGPGDTPEVPDKARTPRNKRR